jgi:hypothetical protein
MCYVVVWIMCSVVASAPSIAPMTPHIGLWNQKAILLLGFN